jgi:amidase
MTEGAYATHHPDMPTPLNPWNREQWTGASSSGSGVATAAGLCYGSLGSDTGGSIRFPSSACGVTGLKPTWGRVSRHGLYPLSESLDHIGPIARTAADAAAILGVIAGADPNDPTALLAPVPDYLALLGGGLDGLRLGIAEDYAFADLDPQVSAVVTDAKRALLELGARPVSVIFPERGAVSQSWGAICAAETALAHSATYPSQAVGYGPSFARFLEAGRRTAAAELARAHIARGQFAGRVAEMFRDIDLLLVPVMANPVPTPAEWSAQVEGGVADLLRFTAEFNLTGQPTITLPGGFDRHGVPIGFQLVGPPLSEPLLLRAGHAYQSITDWHTRHPALDREGRAGSKRHPA